MSALTDLIIQQVGAFQALLFVVLLGADAAQTRYMKGRFDRTDERVARLEGAFIETDGGSLDDFPAEQEPDGDVSAPHHFYIGVGVSLFAFVSVWDLYPVTGAGLVLVGLVVALDDALSHAFGIPTPLDEFWARVLYPALRRLER
jgi:hypothetical protein